VRRSPISPYPVPAAWGGIFKLVDERRPNVGDTSSGDTWARLDRIASFPTVRWTSTDRGIPDYLSFRRRGHCVPQLEFGAHSGRKWGLYHVLAPLDNSRGSTLTTTLMNGRGLSPNSAESDFHGINALHRCEIVQNYRFLSVANSWNDEIISCTAHVFLAERDGEQNTTA